MAKKKLPYQEGDWFSVPLPDGTYAMGVAARVDGEGGVLGYFFGPRFTAPPTAEDVGARSKEEAVSIMRFSDLGFDEGTWKVIHRPEHWDRLEWPIPFFSRHIALVDKWRRITYSDDASREIGDEPCSAEEANDLPRAVLSGSGAAEVRLDMILPNPAVAPKGTQVAQPDRSFSSVEIEVPDEDEQHLLTVKWKFPFPIGYQGPEYDAIMEIDEQLDEPFPPNGPIEYDGNLIGQGWFEMYFYGPDADEMAKEVIPVIKKFSPPTGSYAVKRYGEPGTREERVEIE